MTIVNEIKKPGIVIRDISSDFGDGTYDVLITDEKGNCRYSPEVFNTAESAEKYALAVNDFSWWDQYLNSKEAASVWELVKRVK